MALVSSNSQPCCTNNTMGLNPSRKVRIVAKIRGFTDLEADFPSGVSWISTKKPKGEASETVSLSFGDQSASHKESYEVDHCYEQNEDNDIVFLQEVKPLISGVFDGCNATIIAYGARGSGKTSIIKGTSEKPGLAAMAMDEILSVAEKNGNSVAISVYEVYQDRVCDLLDTKQPAVFVLEDAQGKIQLKGLSRVPVKSNSEFQKLYVSGLGSRKPAQTIANELPRRGHKGLILYVLAHNENSDALLVGKMNFVDLAGYEDSRRKSSDSLSVVENSRLNKSIYALLNVIHALSANESHVPFRESKLTRLLQDSLGRPSRVLMVTCLNPSFCQDSIYMVNLASRCCQRINHAASESAKKSKSLARATIHSSHKSQIPRSVSATAKKQATSRVPLSEKKANGGIVSALKGRRLFDEARRFTTSEKASSMSDNISAVEHSVDEEILQEKPVVTNAIKSLGEGNQLSDVLKNAKAEPISIVEKDDPLSESLKPTEFASTVEKDVPIEENHLEGVTLSVNNSEKMLNFDKEGQNSEKENKISVVDEERSPPISARLREISNNLKSLYSATPPCVKMPEENDASSYALVPLDIMEPKTPMVDTINDRWEVANFNSPWETLSMCSSVVKSSLVQEYLRFLNTANKEELKRLKGVGEKRASYILELREESPEPFKSLDDLKEIGLSAKQVNRMMRKEVGGLFN
ncbi:kinesin-like protein KIN-10C isoform X3 [Ziziphus jujuba]|uniref:Kinesin-like protein KIN-10C isoform X3 n=1 Tax=Ziziphus jujuba TaxID=326968 RepID=A0A6P3ZHJ0_ZIZJJ|nr:kinesin-like protein KIN-10C isoform X3 [Ziziphus jujuba]